MPRWRRIRIRNYGQESDRSLPSCRTWLKPFPGDMLTNVERMFALKPETQECHTSLIVEMF